MKDDKNREKPAVSIIVPVYNAEFYRHEQDFLHECIDSVLKQTLHNIEIICVYREDGYSESILKEYAGRDKRIHIIYQSSSGMSRARNEGIKAASGDYVAFLDSDDFFLNCDALKLLVELAYKEQVDIIGGYLSWAYMAGNRVERIVAHPLNRSEHVPKKTILKYCDYQYDYMFYCYLYKKELLVNESIFFPEDLIAGEDNIFHVKAMIAAKRFMIYPIEFYCWRVGHQLRSKGNVSKTYQMMHNINDLKSMKRLLEISRDCGLPWLHWINIVRINERYQLLRNIYVHDLDALNLLLEAEANIDRNLLTIVERMPPPNHILHSMGIDHYKKIIENKGVMIYPLQCVLSDFEFGYKLKWPLRIIRGGTRCLRENGANYTIKRLFQKMQGIINREKGSK